MEDIKKFLYEDGEGVFSRLRDKDFQFSEEEKEKLIQLANQAKVEVREKKAMKALFIFDVLDSLHYASKDSEEMCDLYEVISYTISK